MAGMMTGLLLLLLVGVTVGRVVDLQKRIFGGQECGPTERLYHVKLIDGKGELVCGGSLIHKEWILTAGHCVVPGTVLTAHLRVHPGANAEAVVIDINHVQRYVEDRLTHDIALLKLPKAKEGFEIVNLPECKKRPLKKKDTVQIAGHATTMRDDANTDQNGLSRTLQCAETTVDDCQVCNTTPPPNHHYDRQRVFCYQRAGVDTRPGDSGGGVMFNKMIYGVHILGYGQVCTGPSVAMNVCADKYRLWIQRITGRLFP